MARGLECGDEHKCGCEDYYGKEEATALESQHCGPRVWMDD